jgi:hypothetical protein
LDNNPKRFLSEDTWIWAAAEHAAALTFFKKNKEFVTMLKAKDEQSKVTTLPGLVKTMSQGAEQTGISKIARAPLKPGKRIAVFATDTTKQIAKFERLDRPLRIPKVLMHSKPT